VKNRNLSPLITIKNKRHKDSFKYKPINRKIFIHSRSVEKIFNDNQNKKGESTYVPCYTSNDQNNRSNHKKNNVIYVNITNYKNINPLIDNNTYNEYGNVIIKENQPEIEEFNINKEIIDSKIKSLEEERDLVVKNIINKYQDKISQFTQKKNDLLMRYSLKNDTLRNNRNLAKKGVNTVENIFVNIKNRNDNNTVSTTTSKY
jgi:hypothetical protein